MQYKPLGPDAEVLGGAMVAFVQSINFENFAPILRKHGINAIDPDQWYPQQMWLDVFTDIANNPNSSSNLVSIGMKIVDSAPAPNLEAIDFEAILMDFDRLYRISNRGADIGGFEVQKLGDKHFLMTNRTPYPDDFEYGIYYAMARKHLPPNTKFVVKYDENTPRREEGGAATLVHIIWQ